MAEAGKPASGGNTAVPHQGDHDRVVMLSLKADGTPDQHNPEIIGDKQFALEAAKKQFAEQAVSAADVDARGVSSDEGGEKGEESEEAKALREAHEKAEKAGEAAAEKAIASLHKGLGDK